MREDETSLFFCILLDLSSNLGIKKVLLGSVDGVNGGTFNLTKYKNYHLFNDNNFGFSAPLNIFMGQNEMTTETYGQFNYNASTGILTVARNGRYTTNVSGICARYNVYLYYV